MSASIVHAVLPNDIDDPASPSGGNVYDRRVLHGLAGAGWSVREYATPGAWPDPRTEDRDGLARALLGLPDGALVLLDGLVASAVPEVLVPAARRLRLAALLHLPVGDEREREVLSVVGAIVTTSDWTRRRVLETYGERIVYVAPPGVDPAPVVPGSAGGARLLCVAAVARHKGHDILVDALATMRDLDFTCACVGPLDRDPDFVAALRARIRGYGLDDRVTLHGPATGADLAARYAAADLLVLPSRGETYGMVVTEALARGIPVVATGVGGVPDALGRAPDGGRPGLLVPPEDPANLAAALRLWLTEPALRAELRQSTLDRRPGLAGWESTVDAVAAALTAVSALEWEVVP